MRPLRRLLSRGSSLNKKLRKAVIHAKPRVVAELLEAGASPTWVDEAIDSSDEMNALLLACHYGHVEILDLLLDAFFETQPMLYCWGRHMYCIVIRNGHWKAFRRIYDRRVPLDPTADSSMGATLPAPMFIAAEVGQSHILQFLVKHNPVDAANYAFSGHSLLSIASKNGHYECVEVLMSMLMVRDEMLDFAIDVARHHAQAHVLVLLTSCLPQYNSNPAPLSVVTNTTRRPSVTFTFDPNYAYSHALSGSGGSYPSKPRRSSLSQNRQRASLAETDIISTDGDDDNQQRRRSSTWLYESEQDLNVYHPYLESDEDETTAAKDAEEVRQYEAYIQGLDDVTGREDLPDSTSTPPPVPFIAALVPRSRSLSIESEEKTEETLARIAERREANKQANPTEKKKKKRSTWLYHNEVILPYEESDNSTATVITATTVMPDISPPHFPKSGKPPLPPPSTRTARTKSFQLPPTITQISRKVISLRSSNMPLGRASM